MDEKNAHESAEKLVSLIQQSAFAHSVRNISLVRVSEGRCYDDGNAIRVLVDGLRTARQLQSYILSTFGNVDGIRCAENLNCLSVTRVPFRPEGVKRPQDFADCFQLLIVGTAISDHFEEKSEDGARASGGDEEEAFLSAFDSEDEQELDDLRDTFRRMQRVLAEILEPFSGKEDLQLISYVNRGEGSGVSPFVVVHGFGGAYRAQQFMKAAIDKIGNANFVSLLDFSRISPDHYGWTGKFGVFFGEQVPRHRRRTSAD